MKHGLCPTPRCRASERTPHFNRLRSRQVSQTELEKFRSFPRMLHVERGSLSHWPSSEMVITNVGGYPIALSPDGQRIVSGSSDGTIRVWNATTGETMAGPFTGHAHSVLSISFSPDGQRC